MKKLLRIFGVLLALCALALPLLGARNNKRPGQGTTATPEESKSIRPLHFLGVDKPVYRPDEPVYIRDVILLGDSGYPLSDADARDYRCRYVILGPRGDQLCSRQMMPKNSVGAMVWRVPKDAAGGIYRVRVEEVDAKAGAPAERTFEVRPFRVPRYRSRVEFCRRGYHPGEKVRGTVQVKNPDGTIPEKLQIRYTVVLDGQRLVENVSAEYRQGVATASFDLPGKIAGGNGTLQFLLDDGGAVESVGMTIPVLLDNYQIAFYPEGGELVAGVKNRVYWESLRNDGAGADVRGRLMQGETVVLEDLSTRHDGRGCFEFTPALNEEYALEVQGSASGEVRRFPLPKAVLGGTLSTTAKVYSAGAPVEVQVAVTPGGKVAVGWVVLSRRDKELDRVQLSPAGGVAKLNPGTVDGVVTATLYAKDGTPLAERLLFLRPTRRLRLEVLGVEKAAVPGERCSLRIRATDADGRPVGAVVGLTVTNAAVQDMVEYRRRAPRLPEMVLLENEVRAFGDAGDYFNPEDPMADEKIDLLLGVQGWRRFIPLRQKEIAAKYGDALRRVMAPPVELMRFRLYKMEVAQAGEDAGAMVDKAVVFAAAPPGNAAPAAAAEVDGAVEGDKAVDAGEVLVAPIVAPMPRPTPLTRYYVREYSHRRRDAGKGASASRSDFTDTICWRAAVTTDPRSGEAAVLFHTSDVLGAFAVMVDGFAPDGSLGSATAMLQNQVPFSVEVKMPLFMSVGDVAQVPVTLVNRTGQVLESPAVWVKCQGGATVESQPVPGGALNPGESRRCMVTLKARELGSAKVQVSATAGGQQDAVMRELQVRSRHFPFAFHCGGKVNEGKTLAMDVVIPADREMGSIAAKVQFYPSPVASLEAALAALLRSPHGCFEQTSSTNYPLVMAQQYFLNHPEHAGEKITQARKLLEEGYGKLVSFQCKNRGYEWFGDDPGHEALTAYGLMEFADMAKVMPVDATMMDNTRKWLLSRRDGQGGFLRNDKALDSFGRAAANTTNAYILWALLESGHNPDELRREIAAVCKKAAEEKDAYLNALAANICHLAGEVKQAHFYEERLAQWQQPDGSIGNAGETITCSRGVSRTLENTALAALAWCRSNDQFLGQLERAMQFCATACQEGRFGSTQSTILVLKAINAYEKLFAEKMQPGTLQLWVDGKPFGQSVAFGNGDTAAIQLPDCGLALTPGAHRLELRMSGGCTRSAAIAVTGMALQPANAGRVTLHTQLDQPQVQEGDPMQLTVQVKNTGKEAAIMPVAVVALPGGTEARTAQLRELTEAGKLAAWELMGNELVLYWRNIPAGGEVTLPIALTAEIPGEYTAAASRAYEYYVDEERQYKPGITVKITPR